jgi:hypothetical protein
LAALLSLRYLRMSFEDDLRRVEEYVAEAQSIVQRQKGLKEMLPDCRLL